MNINPIKLYLYKRKLYFILQLLNNKSTAELLSSGVHRTLDSMFETIGIKNSHVGLGLDRFKGIIRSATIKKLDNVQLSEKASKESTDTSDFRK